MAAAANQARSAAAASLKDSVRELTRYKDRAGPSQRLLRMKVEKVLHDKEVLVSKHYAYAEKSGEDLDSDDLLDWLTPKLDSANDIMDEVEVMIENLELAAETAQRNLDAAQVEETVKNQISIAQKQCDSDETALKDRIAAMMAVVDDETRVTEDDANLIRSHMKQVYDSLEEQIKSWKVSKDLARSEAEMNVIFAKEKDIRKEVADSCSTATAALNKIDPETIVPLCHEPRAGSSVGSVVNESVGSTSSHGTLLKTERMKHPTFDGDIRVFARFKSDFENIVASSHPSKEHQAYVIKESCLKAEAKKLVVNMTNIDDIWERLQDRYGDSLDIVNAVIQGLQNFQFMRNNHDASMVRLVDELERGIQDLTAIGARKDIANGYTVKILEEKLPRHFADRWILEERSSTSASSSQSSVLTVDRFENMYKFLKQERKHAEKMLLITKKDTPKDNQKDLNRKKDGQQFNAAAGGGQKSSAGNKCIIHPNASHFTRRCHAFLSKSVEERGKVVKDANGCKLCLSISHTGKPCPFESTWGKCGINNCDQFHSRLVHGCTIQGIGCYVEICMSVSATETLLLIQCVDTQNGGRAVVFWDGGSTLTLVTKDYATRNNLRGVPVMYDLITLGGVITTHDTMLYEFSIIDTRGRHHLLKAFEIEEICGSLNPTDTKQCAQLFPSTSPAEIARPCGKVDLLIGSDNAPIHPDKKHVHDGLVLYESQFGTGKLLGGKHPDIAETSVINPEAHRCAKARVTNVRISREPKPALDFITTEGMGVEVPERCNNCKNCKVCKFEAYELSRKDQRELDIIRDNLTLDPINKHWTCTYACVRDPAVLQNNKHQAIALAEKTERRVMKDPALLERYNAKFNDLLEDVLVEIPKEEEESYDGPVHYVSHQEVYNLKSSFTPFCIVLNSRVCYCGVSPNEIWLKGPNSLNNMFGILLRFRGHLIALVSDIKRLYT